MNASVDGRAKLEKKVSFTMDRADADLNRDPYASHRHKYGSGGTALKDTSQTNLHQSSPLETNSSGIFSSQRESHPQLHQ